MLDQNEVLMILKWLLLQSIVNVSWSYPGQGTLINPMTPGTGIRLIGGQESS